MFSVSALVPLSVTLFSYHLVSNLLNYNLSLLFTYIVLTGATRLSVGVI